MDRLTFDPTNPIRRQKDRWSCLAKSLAWSASSYGIVVPEGSLERRVLDYHITSPRGLLSDKTGHDIADFMTQEFGGHGLTAKYVPSVSWEEVTREAGLYPMVLGGTKMWHYVSVRGYDPSLGVLLLANTVNGFNGVHQYLTRGQFDYYSPLALVRVTTPQVLEEGPRHAGRLPNRLRGLYRAVTVGGATLYLPASKSDAGGGRGSSRPAGSRTVMENPPPYTRGRGRPVRRVFHRELNREKA